MKQTEWRIRLIIEFIANCAKQNILTPKKTKVSSNTDEQTNEDVVKTLSLSKLEGCFFVNTPPMYEKEHLFYKYL